jgi:hypothetical protein
MGLVLRKARRAGKRLAHVFLFEIRQFLDDLSGGHAVRHQIDDVRDGDAKAADGGPASHHGGIRRDPIEAVSNP